MREDVRPDLLSLLAPASWSKLKVDPTVDPGIVHVVRDLLQARVVEQFRAARDGSARSSDKPPPQTCSRIDRPA